MPSASYACRMLPRQWLSFCPFVVCLSLCSLSVHASSPADASTRTLVFDGLGKDAVPIDGPWQFHLGDNPAWASPSFDDSQWEQLTADKSWGAQTHPSYTGFAWYRRAISVKPAPGAGPDFALLIPAVDDAYEIYWNGIKTFQPNLIILRKP